MLKIAKFIKIFNYKSYIAMIRIIKKEAKQ